VPAWNSGGPLFDLQPAFMVAEAGLGVVCSQRWVQYCRRYVFWVAVVAVDAIGGSNALPPWVVSAGYRWIRLTQKWSMTVGGAPYLWHLVRRNVESRSFLWATALLFICPLLTTPWAAMKIICPLCHSPVYFLWLFGYPRDRPRVAFDWLPACPYCLDDGTATTGNARGVNPKREVGRVLRYAFGWLLIVCTALVLFWFAMVRGWVPGYKRILLGACGPRCTNTGSTTDTYENDKPSVSLDGVYKRIRVQAVRGSTHDPLRLA
jgi:hypothetical protein